MIDLNNQTLTSILLLLAGLRVYLEIIDFPFHQLPISKLMGEEKAKRFHRFGLVLSLGLILFAAPQVLIKG